MKNISQPTLLLNEQICRNNIQKMMDKVASHNLYFKPHMKTHQSAEIGNWLNDVGIEAITVSSVRMAEYFANNGWEDITIAFPCNTTEIRTINKLAETTSLTLLVNNQPTAHLLHRELTSAVKVYIELDTGARRTGFTIEETQSIMNLIQLMDQSQKLHWIGFYSHPGHSYSARSSEQVEQIHQEVLQQINTLRNKLEPSLGTFEVCIGDTPCCSIATDFEGIDAISPGNFIFYDLMQHRIGSCEINEIATAMACPIVDTFPERNELAIYGGAVHFSKESLQEKGLQHFGLPVVPHNSGWKIIPNSYIKALSQEHGLISATPHLLDKIGLGDTLVLLPIHSCLTANLMGEFTLSNGHKVSQF